MAGKVHEIFVPGRLSILGEHSDWASSYRSANPAVSVGRCLVCATNEGLFAKASTSTTPGITYMCLDRDGLELSFTHTFDLDALHVLARGGGFFAYVAGTVAAIIEAYDLAGGASTSPPGIHINNYKSTLPMKKGLSSSAAVCVLVVMCFAALFGWELDQNEIMALAYKGEKKTPSECGMMDFCVAMGANSVGLMTLNENGFCRLDRVFVSKPLYFVVADLNKGKNTVKILHALNDAFPVPRDEMTWLVHEYMRKNQFLCLDAVRAVETGNVDLLAEIMTQAQQCFDAGARQVCPEELTSPKLHAVLNNPELKRISLAAKGVGSQGDGSVQVLCGSAEQQRLVLTLLTQELDCNGFPLTLSSSSSPRNSTENFSVHLLSQLHTQHVRSALVLSSRPLAAPQAMEATVPKLLQLLACGISKCSVICPSAPTSVFDAESDSLAANAPVTEPLTENEAAPSGNGEFSYREYQKKLIEDCTKFHYHELGDATARQHCTVQALSYIEMGEGSENVLVIKEEALSEAFTALMRNLDTTHCTTSSATGTMSPRSIPLPEPNNDDACIMSMAELKTELLDILMQRKVLLRTRRLKHSSRSEVANVL